MVINTLLNSEKLMPFIDESSLLPKLIVLIGFSPDSTKDMKDSKLLKQPFPTNLSKFEIDPMLLPTVVAAMQTKRDFFWCTAEEYQFYIHQQLANFFQVSFVYNNLYHYAFPIYYTIDEQETIYNDYQQEDEDISSATFSNVSQFYSALIKTNKLYGVYSFEEDTIKKWKPFFEVLDAVTTDTIELGFYDYTVELVEDETPFLTLIDKLIGVTEETKVQIIHSNDFTVYSHRYLERIAVLNKINPNLQFTFSKPSLTLRKFDESLYLQYLKKYWGYDAFRTLEMYKDPDTSKELITIQQSQIINDIVEEAENAQNQQPFRDVFVTSSTGAGKSVMFQLPAFLLHEKYQLLTIVISPLIGLMKDQVASLKSRGIHNVATINSNVTPAEKGEIHERIKNKELALLYVSPETLLSRSDIKALIGEETQIGLFVVDEAHIVTTWGKAFRSDYWYLGTYLQKLRKEMKFPIATFTATAIYGGEEDMYKETRDSLALINPKFYLGKVRRDDLSIHIQSKTSDLKQFEYQKTKFFITAKRLADFMKRGEKVLVYFPTVPLIHNFSQYLEENHPRIFAKTVIYNGQLKKEIKEANGAKFANGEASIMLATKAFGMGIDIPDIHTVYHYAPTGNVCDYVQEIGRAARDPQIDGKAYFDFLKNDFSHIKRLHGMSTIRKHQLQLVAQKIHSIYKEKKYSRNLLVNVEDFAYIFSENSRVDIEGDIDGKLKTALLLLEKDFVHRIGYSPFVARPRGLFSREYFQVTKLGEQLLSQKKHAAFTTKITSLSNNGRYEAIYEINLKAIWEKYYRKLSFPDFKRRFHEKEESIQLPFLNEIDAIMVVNFTTNEPLNYALNAIQLKLDKITKSLTQMALTNKFFNPEFLAKLLQKEFNIDFYVASNLSEIILYSMVRYNRLGQNSNTKAVIRFDETKGYQISPSFEDFFKFVKARLKSYFTSGEKHANTDGSYSIYLSKTIRNIIDQMSIVFGIAEALNELSYQIQGGNTPEIYIRINSTLQLESMIKHPENYKNQILSSVHYRHKLSVAMMKHIFEQQMQTSEFWDTIESYFLGDIPEHVIQEAKYQKK